MAAVSSDERPFFAHDPLPADPADPFWTTPRTNPHGYTALMAAIQQVVPSPPPTTTPRRPVRSSPSTTLARRPQCTHVTMDRQYGHHVCQFCGKVPSLGWVYACRQDHRLSEQTQEPLSEPEALPVVADGGSYFEAQATLAESLGMSKSVVSQMRAEAYTFDQIDILLDQRRHALDVMRHARTTSAQRFSPQSQLRRAKLSAIASNIIASVGSSAAPMVQEVDAPALLPMTPAGTPSNTPAESNATTPTKSSSAASKKAKCNFQVCHACRPFFRDRLPMNIVAALNNEVPAVTEDEIEALPFLDPDIVRNLGLRHPPKLSLTTAAGATMRQCDGLEDDTPTDITPTTTTTSGGSCGADTDVLDSSEDYPCPGPGICPVRSQYGGCAYDHGFDDGQRALNHGFARSARIEHAAERPLGAFLAHVSQISSDGSSTGSSISLPETASAPVTPATSISNPSFSLAMGNTALRRSGKARTLCGVPSEDRKTRHTFADFHSLGQLHGLGIGFGEEVEVHGGVALTEEAVGTGVPDIVTAGAV